MKTVVVTVNNMKVRSPAHRMPNEMDPNIHLLLLRVLYATAKQKTNVQDEITQICYETARISIIFTVSTTVYGTLETGLLL